MCAVLVGVCGRKNEIRTTAPLVVDLFPSRSKFVSATRVDAHGGAMVMAQPVVASALQAVLLLLQA